MSIKEKLAKAKEFVKEHKWAFINAGVVVGIGITGYCIWDYKKGLSVDAAESVSKDDSEAFLGMLRAVSKGYTPEQIISVDNGRDDILVDATVDIGDVGKWFAEHCDRLKDLEYGMFEVFQNSEDPEVYDVHFIGD